MHIASESVRTAPALGCSGRIEQVFLDCFAGLCFPVEPTAFSGRSDYGPFIAGGIPAVGLFTVAESINTEEQVTVYGGTAGDQYDPCYHLAGDTLNNISLKALDQNSDDAAHSVLTFAMTTSSVYGTDHGKATESPRITWSILCRIFRSKYLNAIMQ